MIKKLSILLFFIINLNSKDFTICSYNVENLFDLTYNKTEYKEYIPNSFSNWNNSNFNTKLSNTIKVLEDLDCDILALQELENENVLKLLQNALPRYNYNSFAKSKNASVGLGFLSKLRIINSNVIEVNFLNKTYRPILETTFKIDSIEFKLFNNHWPSKRASESYRIKYAKRLFDRVNTLPKDYDYILLGDFNSNYNEFETIKYEKKLNDTQGITGINQVLNTTVDKEYITLDDILREDRRVHYNSWLQLPYKERFSTIYKGEYNTPDNIILSPALFDNKKINYIKDSFKVYKPNYLYKKNNIIRWQIKGGKHQQKGYSDHLPIMAKFTTNKISKSINSNKKANSISYLYKKIKLIEPIVLKDAIVIYKSFNHAIIKQKNDRAIFLYNNAENLQEGFSYDIKIEQIKEYFGLKEISSFTILKKNNKESKYKNLYIKNLNIDFNNSLYQNEIITNIQGFYKNNSLYFENKRVKIYFKDKELKPKDGSYLIIKRAQIGYYKSTVQLVINNRSDIDVN